MKKTTITFTSLPYRATGTPGAGGKLHLSVFIAPRLWTTDSEEQTQILHLKDYPPLFKKFPSQIAALKFGVSFNGGAPLPATPVSAGDLRDDLWAALFPETIPVKPYRFDNLAEIPIQSIDSIFLYDWLRDLYRKVGTDPAYGLGASKPSRDVLRRDPDLAQIARPSKPEPPYEPPAKRRVPIYYQPGETEEEEGTGKKGCLQLLLDILNAITKVLGLGQPFNAPAAGATAPLHPPAVQHPTLSPAGTGVTAPHMPAAPLQVKPQAGRPAVPTGSTRATNPVMAQFNAVTDFVTPFDPTPAPAVHLSEEQLEALLDFHEAVSLVADTPTLLRALGLVVDLEVDWTPGIPAEGTVAVTLMPSSAAGALFYPLRTHYTLSGTHFLPAPRKPKPKETAEMRQGLLRLSDEERYRIIQLDVVGAALKEQNTATLLASQQVQGLQLINPPEEESLPATRSAGLAVVQRDLATQLQTTYVQAAALNNAVADVDGSPEVTLSTTPMQLQPTNDLWAEDVTRGYRMDVCDLDSASKKWRSLHQRQGTCRFTGAHPEIAVPVEDEGFVELGVTEPVSDTPDVQRIPDTIVTWTGWSLSAVRPGKIIGENPDPSEAVETPTNEAKTAFKLQVDFTPVSGSLPRLRFGHRYVVRMRTVDLAGNSVFGPADAEFQQAHPDDSDIHVYRRFEPVPAPAVVLRAKPVEGESVERLVLRSAAGGTDPYNVNRQTTERHIVPPKSSQLLAEYHGKFDGNGGKPKADAATYEQAALEANTLSQRWAPINNKWVLLPLPGTETFPDAEERKDPTFWQTKEAFPLTYLPDELARQAVFRNLPGPAESVVSSYPFNGEWPSRLPFRLKVVGIPAGQTPKPPLWAPQKGELVVELPQGESRVVRLNSGTDESDLPEFGVWEWETNPPAPTHSIIAANTAQGLNWLLMPPRELHLVHATQKPLELPKIIITKAEKVLGDTTAAVSGSIQPHSQTTGKVDVLALWTDPEDDITKDAPGEHRSRAALCEIHMPEPDATSVAVEATHSLGDTHYHRVVYVARGATRFREYMPEALLEPGKEDLITAPTEIEIKTLASKTMAQIEGEIAGGTLQHAAVQDVKNSARPLAPVVAFIMPTLGVATETTVEQTAKVKVITRTRHNSGLRVYLERPWFSSGAGELLGVVFRDETFATLDEALRPYVTEWADDPLWNGPVADLAADMGNFTHYAASSNDVIAPLTLEETNAPVKVVGYPVEFDAAKKLWFADIEFTMNSLKAYMPMVRLALARFQPISVPPAYLSRVTRADFVQPLPDRTLIISRLVSNPMHITLALTGVAPTGPRPVQAWMEKLTAPAQGELGWTRLEGDAFKPAINTESAALWEGTFNPGLLPPSGRYRIVIQEMEPLLPGGFAGTLPDGVIGGVSQLPTGPFLGRTVYADTVEL